MSANEKTQSASTKNSGKGIKANIYTSGVMSYRLRDIHIIKLYFFLDILSISHFFSCLSMFFCVLLCRDMLWTAPELLRMESPPYQGTQKGDVYTFAIILQELLYRALPYFLVKHAPKGENQQKIGQNRAQLSRLPKIKNVYIWP